MERKALAQLGALLVAEICKERIEHHMVGGAEIVEALVALNQHDAQGREVDQDLSSLRDRRTWAWRTQ